MKKLENYGVLEMNAQEIREIDGGTDPFDNWQPSQDTVWLGTVSSGGGRHPLNQQYDETGGRNPLSPLGQLIADWLWG